MNNATFQESDTLKTALLIFQSQSPAACVNRYEPWNNVHPKGKIDASLNVWGRP